MRQSGEVPREEQRTKWKRREKQYPKVQELAYILCITDIALIVAKKLNTKMCGVDHKKPLRLGGINDITYYLPACRSCNHYKSTLDVEGYRKYLQDIHKRLMRDSIPYQVAERFGIVKHISNDILFYFEKVNR